MSGAPGNSGSESSRRLHLKDYKSKLITQHVSGMALGMEHASEVKQQLDL